VQVGKILVKFSTSQNWLDFRIWLGRQYN